MQNTFLKKILLLMSGTALGQLIIFLSSPILTRLYSPEDFGLLNLYTSILSVLLVLCSLRYEMAIPIAEDEQETIHIVIISIFILIAFSALIAILIAIVDIFYINLSKISYTFPISLFFIGSYQIFTNWHIRNSNFNLITKTKLSQSITLTFSTIIMRLFHLKSNGLILGDTIGKSSGSLLMFRKFIKKISWQNLKYNIQKTYLLETIKKYKKYPLITTWSSLLNVAGIYLSPALFTLFFDNNIGGYFSFGHKIVGTPILLIGQSVSQVYMSTFSKKEHPLHIFKKLILTLSIIGIITATILFLYGGFLFSFIFGVKWKESGEYIEILSFMYLFYIVAFPVSQTLTLLGKQLKQLFWDLSRVLFICGLFLSASIFSLSNLDTLKIYSIGMGLFYFILLILIYLTLKKDYQE
ncbi:lipopolysaccharide biosynthesis protein [Bacillus thuringiensis]|uniref:lipopolysaccharide biosynthesis protein n=1 Tax=Bacillus thuringiensis TaxID=1428 RepID=UPI003D0087C0